MNKQNLNIGDALLCKLDFKYFSNKIFYKDEYYAVGEILLYNSPEVYTYYISDEIGGLHPFRYNEDLLYSTFYKKQELRNMKLKKLNENKES